MDEFSDRIERLGIRCLRGVSAKALTTFGSGGAVRYLAFPQTAEEVVFVIGAAKECGVPYRAIGGGSNVLLHDRGYGGALIRLSRMDGVERSNETLTVGAGVKMPVLSRFAAACGLSGAEFACGIPGTMGGAAAVNAGAFGQSLSDLLVEVTMLTAEGKVERVDPCELGYGYHRAMLPRGAIVLSMTLRLVSSDEMSIEERMRGMREKRRRTQPKEPSAGSVFRRVGSVPAALYVERTGLKGMRVGGAMLSPVHCNFIVNAGGATTDDYFALAEKVREKVMAQNGALLEYEVERLC